MSDDTTDRGDQLDELIKDAETPTPKEPEKEPEKAPEKEKEPDPEPQIPKSRFDEAVQKERGEKAALAARVQEYEERDAQTQVTNDFAEAQKMVKDMIKQHTAFLADGELDKASDLMERILGLNQAIGDRKADMKALQTKFAAKEEVQYDAMVAKLEVDYPQINPDSDEYDKAVVENVQAMMAGFMQGQRMTGPQALAKAVKVLLPAPGTAAKPDKGDDVGLKRKAAAVKTALDAKGKQPASLGGVGQDHDKEGGALDAAAVMKMTWDEFVKLPDEKLAEMRGDHVS